MPGTVRYEVSIRSNLTERKKLNRLITSETNIFETIMKRYKFPTPNYYLEMWAYDSENSGCEELTIDDAYYFDYESPLIELVPPTNLRWNGYTARWDEVPNCEKYRITLYSKYGHRRSIIETEDTFYNYGTDVSDGEYFKVEAIGGDGYMDSVESAKSPIWKIPVVREVNIVVTPPIAGEIPNYNASTDSTECTVDDNEVGWVDSDTRIVSNTSSPRPLEAGHTYIASIWLKPKSGYKIYENTVVKINGMTAYKGASSSDLSGELIEFSREFTVDGTANLYSVNFDSTGGSEVAAQTLEENGVETRPADPVRDGYNFEGWYTEAECINAYDFNSQITGDITLFAKWVKKDTDGSGSGSGSGSGKSGGGSRSGGGSSSGGGSKGSGGTKQTKKMGEWQQDATGWWYKYANGTYPKATWDNIDGAWYAFNEAGYMRTGWISSGDKWNYLNPASGEMLLGWQNIGGKYYYFNTGSSHPQGAMYANEKTPDGYSVNANGEWIQ